MKQLSFLLLLTILISSYSYGQDHRRFLTDLNDNPTKVVLKFNKVTKHDPHDWKFEYLFDYYGNILFQKSIHKGKVMTGQFFDYNEKGDIIYEKKDYLDTKGDSSEVFKTVNNYDSQDRLIKQTISNEQGDVLLIIDSLTYDCNNLVYYIKDYLKDGKKFTFHLSYDNENTLDSTIMYVMNGGYTNVNYKYYTNGQVLESDIKNLVIIDNEKIPIDHVKEYLYIYDKHGNWTKRYVRIDYGKKQLELKRKITYR